LKGFRTVAGSRVGEAAGGSASGYKDRLILSLGSRVFLHPRQQVTIEVEAGAFVLSIWTDHDSNNLVNLQVARTAP